MQPFVIPILFHLIQVENVLKSLFHPYSSWILFSQSMIYVVEVGNFRSMPILPRCCFINHSMLNEVSHITLFIFFLSTQYFLGIQNECGVIYHFFIHLPTCFREKTVNMVGGFKFSFAITLQDAMKCGCKFS